MIDEKRKVVFIHIAKNAGSSILAGFGIRSGHYPAIWHKRQLGRMWKHFYKFAVVRNPWDRYVSLYRYWGRMSKMKHYLGSGRHTRRMLRDKEGWYRINVPSFGDSVSKIRWLMRHDVTVPTYKRQLPMVSQRGKIIVNDVFKFERIEEWWPSLSKRYDLGDLQEWNRNLPGRHYSAYYSDEMADIIRQHYASDVQEFGYSFERLEKFDRELVLHHA